MVKRSRLVFVFLLIALASRYFSMTIQGDLEEQDPACLPSSLTQEIIFEFNQTYKEQTFDFTQSNIELSEFNSLIMFFVVTGDKSTNQGLDVVFFFNSSKVNFTINRLYQDNLEHNLSQAFAYPYSFLGEMNITVVCKGQTELGESGLLVIHSSTIHPLTPPTLTQQLSPLPTVPDSFSAEGSVFSTERISLLTAFYSFNETAEANITLTFTSNCTYAFQSFVEFQFNGELVAEKDFEVDEFNALSLSLYPKYGLNFLTLVFVYRSTAVLINVQDIHLSAYLFFNVHNPADSIYDWVKWEDETLNHTFNLSSLKPETYSNEQIVSLKLNCKHIRTLLSPLITYQILAGTRVVYEGRTSYSQQSITAFTLSTKFISISSQEQLLLRLFGDQESTGIFSIFNSSSIILSSLSNFNNGSLEQSLASNFEITPPAFGIIHLSFTDFFKVANYSAVDLTFHLNILSEYEEAFDYTVISLKLNNSCIIYLKADYHSTIYETELASLYNGIYEIKLEISIYGIQSPFSFQNITYQFLPHLSEPSVTYIFNWYNIDWILAIYGFLFLIFNEKIIFRRGMKRKCHNENYDQPPLEEEEEKKKERNKFILQLIVSVSVCFIFLVLLHLFHLFHWSLATLAILCSYYLGTLVEYVSFEKGKIKKWLVKVREFFDGVESFYDLFSKTIETLSRKSRKQMWRAGLIAFIIGSLAVNVGLLFFVADKLRFIIDESNLYNFFFTNLWQAYYFLFACVIVSTLALYYAIHFVRTMAFVEDNLRRTRTLGNTSILLLAVSILCINIIILGTIPDFSTLWTFSSPLLLLGVVKTSNNLGEVLAEEEKDDKTTRIISLKEYLRNGKVWTNKREMRQALSFGITTRTKWLKEKHSLQKKKLNGTIIWNITAGIQIPLSRLAELTKLTKKKTELLLLEILNEQPKLGKYYKEEQVFIKATTDDTSGTVKMTEDESPPTTEKKEEKGITQSVKPATSVKSKIQEMYDAIEGRDEKTKILSLQNEYKLTTKEADIFLRFLNKGLGKEADNLSETDIEFLQKAIKKIYKENDVLQRNSQTNLLREIYDDLEDNLHGFDDVILSKINNKYKIIFSEYKGGDYVAIHPWDYLPRRNYHLNRIMLNRKQLSEFINKGGLKNYPNKNTSSIKNESDFPQFILKLFYDRNRQYHGIGNDWLIKLRNKVFHVAMNMLVKKGFITEKIMKRIIKGLYEQNEIIGLAQNGHIIRHSPKGIVNIFDHTEIKFNGNTVKISYLFFMPKFLQRKQKNILILQGFSGKLNENEREINSLIIKKEIRKGLSDDEILVLLAKIKREFLNSLFSSKKLNNLRDLVDGRGFFALETMVSTNLQERIYEWFDNFNKRRGISCFYDYANHFIVDFLHPKDFRKIFSKAIEATLFSNMTNLLMDPDYLFDTESREYILSQELFRRRPFTFFLFEDSDDEKRFPPRFNYWDHRIPPNIGIVLVNDREEFFYHKPPTGGSKSAKVMGIKLIEEDILLNFPFRWDNSTDGFIFGRHSRNKNEFTEVGIAWSSWLKDNDFNLPKGPSAKIPDESVMVLLLEWIKRLNKFEKERILENSDFIEFCERNKLIINPMNGSLLSEKKVEYRIAKVSMDKGNRLRHTKSWKLFNKKDYSFEEFKYILKGLIFDITVREKNIDYNNVKADWEKWLEKNWLEEFKSLKRYFYDK